MGSRVADGPYLGLLVPDLRIKTGNLRVNDGVTGNSDYSEAGPRPGVPAFDQDEVAAVSTTAGDFSPSLSLEALGEQDTGTDYHVKVVKAGMPGRDATIAQRPSLTSGDWRGWNTHNVLGHLEKDAIVDRDPGSNVNYGSCRTADDQALFVWWDNNTIKGRKYNPETHAAASNVTIVDSATNLNTDTGIYLPFAASANVLDVLLLPSGRLVVYYLTREVDGLTTTATLWTSYSDDDGDSWRTGQYLGLDVPLATSGDTIYKLRTAYYGAYVLLVIEKDYAVGQGTHRGLVQYASDDTGLNFTLIRDDETEGLTTGVEHPEIVVDRSTGTFLLIYEDDTANTIAARRLANPYTPYPSGELVTVRASSIAPDHVVAYEDPDGYLYATWDTTDGIDLYHSRDGGSTWSQLEEVYNWNTTSVAFRWTVTSAGARSVWMIGQITTPGSLELTDHKFIFVESGGWNTICQPRILGTEPTTSRGFGSTTSPEAGTWIPTDKPENLGFALVGATTAVQGTAPVGLNLSAITHYQVVPAGAHTDGLVVFFGLAVGSTPDIATLEVGLELTLDTFKVEIRFSSTNVRIRDVHAGGDVGTGAPSGGMSSEQVFKVAMRKSGAAANGCSITLYRRAPADEVWTQLVAATTLTAGASTTNLIDWGQFATGESCTWTFFHWCMDAGNGDQNQAGDDLSQDATGLDPLVLYGAPLAVPPYRSYLDLQLYVRGTSGPGTRGDTWKIQTRYDHPIEALDPQLAPSPARSWRSVGTSEAVITWDPAGGLDSTLGNNSIGLYLGGINFPAAELRGWNGAAWVVLGTLHADQGLQTIPCVVTGNTIEVDTGTSAAFRYVLYNEFRDGTVKFNNGEIRRIEWNSEGTLTDVATKRPSFRFAGATPGVVATMDLWHTSALLLVHETTTIYDRYSVRIPSQSTADGYFKIGVCLVGAMAVFGRKYAHGRVINTIPNYSLARDRSGRSTARELGKRRRSVSLGWSPVDLTAIGGSSPAPDFVSLRGVAPPVADRHGAPLLVEGLIDHLGGGAVPAVYVVNIPETSPGDLETRQSARESYVYGRVVDTLTRSAVLGTENETEVVEISGLRLDEEV